MAGEKRGAALETLIAFTLSRASKFTSSLIKWDEPLSELIWKPDFFVYPTEKVPGFVGLVTYAGSETDSRQKFWRNLAEYFDAKLKFSNIQAVSFVAGVSRQKQIALQRYVFNSVIILEDIQNKQQINRILNEIAKDNSNKREKSKLLESMYCCDAKFKNLVDSIIEIIDSLPENPAVPTSFWQSVASHGFKVNATEILRFRRGIAKSLLLSDLELMKFKSGDRIIKLPHHYGLIKAGILGYIDNLVYLTDEDIFFASMNTKNLSQILSKYSKPTGVSVVKNLQNLGDTEDSVEWIYSNKDIFANSNIIAELLDDKVTDQPSSGRLYAAIKQLLSLSDDESWMNDLSERSGEMRSVLVGLILPGFERGQARLPENVRNTLSIILSERLPKLLSENNDIATLVDKYVRTEIENKLVCHGIDGVGAMIEEHLQLSSAEYSNYKLPSGLSEAMSFSANDFSTKGILVNGKVYIHWKTVTNEGRGHKVKELSARVYQSRRKFTSDEFEKRHNPEIFILVIDGQWEDIDLENLSIFGWDAIIPANRLELINSFL